MESLLAGLRAVAEISRLRLLHVLAQGEYNVSELTYILGQSQPRISRHLKLMVEAGVLDRYKEGSWVLFRLGDGALPRAILALMPTQSDFLARDAERIRDIRERRAAAAEAFFNAHAEKWIHMRALHVHEATVDAALLALLEGRHFQAHLDIGTGTGSILELLQGVAEISCGIDSSPQMLAIARQRLEKSGQDQAQVRHGDLYSLPFPPERFDLVTLHQVLHYLDDPERALVEAARVLKPGGLMAIVDFAPHDLDDLRENQAHRRLGLSEAHMAGWLARSGLVARHHTLLPAPESAGPSGLTVSLWSALKPAAPSLGSSPPASPKPEIRP